MTFEFDVIIVGSGPAGVSAAFPLLEAGFHVLVIDGGRETRIPRPEGPYLTERSDNPDQWLWMVGSDFYALRNADAISPKLRVPTHSYVFNGFESANRIYPQGFVSVGSLATGGLSNAWGCGVAKLSADDLAAFPFPPTDLDASYEAVARRIGVSGSHADDMSEYFGLDELAQAPVPMDALQSHIYKRYGFHRAELLSHGFRLGRSRLAVLSENRGERKACDLSGTCLWGCDRRALYSAADDLSLMKRYPNFHYRPGFVVDGICEDGGSRIVTGQDVAGPYAFRSKKVILAAGTLASTRLALKALRYAMSVTMQACPTAAFMLWVPRMLGRRPGSEFGLGQLSFAVSLDESISGFGSLFNTTGIPVAEFTRHMPLRKRYAIDVLSSLLSSCVVGNIFLPGHLTRASLSIVSDGDFRVQGQYKAKVSAFMGAVEQRLRNFFWKLGALLLPRSFTIGRPGSDIHYACSLPMRKHPVVGETTPDGELFGLKGVYVVDGASLSALTEKSHTMTIMANADRISRKVAMQLGHL